MDLKKIIFASTEPQARKVLRDIMAMNKPAQKKKAAKKRKRRG